MAPHRGVWGTRWTVPRPSHQKGGRVAVVSDDVAEGVTDLSVSELFGEVQAQEHGTVQVRGGVVLLWGRGADDGVGVVHADMMARIQGVWGNQWTPHELAHQNPTPSESLLSYRKSEEVRGSTVDEKGRHRSCLPVIIVTHCHILNKGRLLRINKLVLLRIGDRCASS